MQATSENILEAFNQLPEIEKHALASEIIKQLALLDIPPWTDEALTVIADPLFVEHDKIEVADAEDIIEVKSGWLISEWSPQSDLGVVIRITRPRRRSCACYRCDVYNESA